MNRSSSFLTLLFGVFLLGAAGWTYKELLWSAFGSLDDAGQRLHDTRGERVALLASDYTRLVNASRGAMGVDPAWLPANLDTWRAFLASADARVTEVSDSDVEEGNLERFAVLVLPSTAALSDRQIEQIKDYLYRGGSVIASWTPGIYRPDGSWRGWSFVQETFGVEPVRFLDRGMNNFEVYTDTFPGIGRPGLYLPADDHDVIRDRQADPAAVSDEGFAPLSGYVWQGAIASGHPASDFAVAETVVTGDDRIGAARYATRVQFFTWLGGDPVVAAEAALASGDFGRVTFRGSTPLSAGLPAAFRMKTGTFDQPLQLKVVEPRTEVAAFWYDFAASDQTAREGLGESAAVVYGTYGAGRFVYLGHELSAMGYEPADQSALAHLFSNALRWLQRAPVTWVETWPAPYRAAALVVGMTQNEPTALEPILGPFREHGIRATLFLPPAAAADYPELTARLMEHAEVGMVVDPAASIETLSAMRARFEAVTGKPAVSARILHSTRLPAETVARLRSAGFDYVLPDTLGRALQPRLYGRDGLVSIFRTARSDHDLLARTPAGTREDRLALILDELDRVEVEGGLYTLVVGTDGLGQISHLPVLRAALGELKDRSYWTPSGSEIARWTRAHAGLTARVERRGPRRINVRVSNNGDVRAENAVVTVELGWPVGSYSVRPELVGTPMPETRISSDGTRLTFLVDPLAPRDIRIYQVDLIPADPLEEAEPLLANR